MTWQKRLSHYLYFFSNLFFFLFFSYLSWTYYTEGSVGKCHITSVTQSHDMMSHDRHGKIVHRPCSSCISSIENLTRTLSSSLCQSLNKEQLALFQLGVQLPYKLIKEKPANEQQEVKIRLHVNLQQDQRTHNLPTAEEIVVIIPEEGVHHAMDNRDVVL